MAINNYPVATDFANGLLLDLLTQEMPAVWPSDVFPAQYSAAGPPGSVINTGNLKIETARILTSQENQDALNHFQVHNPADGVPAGVTIATLPPPTMPGAGVLFFVSDLAQGVGPGMGTMAYSNGTEWRRVSDDALVV